MSFVVPSVGRLLKNKRLNLALCIAATLGLGGTAVGQTTVFSDTFTTSAGTAFSGAGPIGTSTVWSNTVAASSDFGAKIDGGVLTLTNDASATANANGWVYSSTTTSGFTSPFNSTLSANTGTVSWEFNLRQIRTDPAGYASGSYAAAFVLGSTTSSVFNSGNGYAIVYGQSGATDPIRLARFTNGLSGTLTNIITATSVLSDVGADYLSLRVEYTPSTNSWAIFGRNDGTTAFTDVTTGSLASLGSSATDSTYTSSALTNMGAYWGGSTAASQTTTVDNVYVKVGSTGGSTAKNLTWNLTVDGAWDKTTANWVGDATIFTDGDFVTFNKIEGGNVSLSETLSPGTTTVSAASGTYTFTGVGAIGGAGSLTKSNGGTLVLAGNNTYSGGTVLSGGTLQFSTATPIGAGAITISGNATLKSTAGSSTTLANSATIAATGATIDSGSSGLTLGSAAPSLTTLGINGPLTKTGAGDLTLAGTITSATTGVSLNVQSGNLILNPTGNSTLNISANSTLAGNLILATGSRLNVNEGATLSSTGGELRLKTTGALISQTNGTTTGTITAPVKLNSDSTASTPGSFSGTTYSTTGAFVTTFGAGSSTTTGVATTLNLNGVISGDSDVDFSINSVSGGGTGTTVLGAAMAYTGTTTINTATPATQNTDGSIKLGVDNALPNNGLVYGNKSNAGLAVLNLNGKNQAVAYLADGGTISATKFLTINNLTGTTNSTLTVGSAVQPGTAKFGGVLADGGSNKLNLVKTGSNTQSLSGVSTYTGTTTVSQGTLTLAQGGQLGATDVSVASGATMATAYTAGGSITGGSSLSLASGAALNLGDGTANTLNFIGGSSALSGGTLTFDILSSSSFDVLALGSTSLSGTNTIAFNGTPTLDVGTYSLITGTFNSGVFFTGPASLGGFSLAYNNTGSTIDLVVSNAGGGGTVTLGAAAANGGAFGNVLLGSTVSTTVTLTNSGTIATTDVTGVAVTGFTIGAPASQVIASGGGTTTSTVTVDTSTSGDKSGNLTYTANPGAVVSTPVIALSAHVNTATYGATMSAATPNGYTTPAGGLSSSGNGTAGTGLPPALHSTATILNYTNSSGTDTSVNMTWRLRTADEASNISGLNDNGNKVAGYLISDVLNLTGMVNSTGTQTDTFVLQMTYSEALLNGYEAAAAANGKLFLASLSGSEWINATDLNIAADTGLTINNYNNDFDTTGPNAPGSWANFVAQYNVTSGNLSNFIGSWGVDQANNQVWAILDHNSEFAVIPEPSTLALGGVALLGFAGFGLRRRRMKSV